MALEKMAVLIVCVLIIGVFSGTSRAASISQIQMKKAEGSETTSSGLSALDDFAGVHPRLYLDASRLAALKEIATPPIPDVYLQAYVDVLAAADSGATPPVYRPSNDDQIWQRDVGDVMPSIAMAYLLTGQKKYLRRAETWALAACNYPTWGSGKYNCNSLGAGHIMLGLALTYDWLYADLSQETRTAILNTLKERGAIMYGIISTNPIGSENDWTQSYMANHLWVKAMGLAAAGLAIYEEAPEAKAWVEEVLGRFKTSVIAMGTDGASQEGAGYWQYGTEYRLKFMYLCRDLLNVDMFDDEWFRNAAFYALYMTIPRNSWTSKSMIVDIGDSPRYNWYGPDYLLRALGAEYGNGYAQWLASQIDVAGIDSPVAPWLNLLWHDPNLEAKAPDDLPTLRYFDNLDIVSARSGWSGDESLVVFKCGQALGRSAMDNFNFFSRSADNYMSQGSAGHVHPDANTFGIFGAGQWLVRYPGYVQRQTAFENTLLVDGRGQLGQLQSAGWWDSSRELREKLDPQVIKAQSTPELDHIVGEASASYPDDLSKYERHLLFVKPNALIVIDDIKSKDSQKSHDYQLLFHLENSATAEADGSFTATGSSAALRVQPLTPDGAVVTAGEQAVRARRGGGHEDRPIITVQSKGTEWRNAMAFSWSPVGGSPEKVQLSTDGGVWVFTVGSTQVLFDWTTREASIQASK